MYLNLDDNIVKTTQIRVNIIFDKCNTSWFPVHKKKKEKQENRFVRYQIS